MGDTSTSSALLLRRGHEVTSWSWVKMRLARADIEALQTMIDVWNLEHPAKLSGAVEDDGKRVVFAFSETPSPPLVQWSACLGTAISAMRAALDSIAWQAAHLDGAKPRKPKRLYFPTLEADDAKGWKEWDSNVPDMSEELRSRFHDVYDLRDGAVGPALKVLNELNNIDKHRSSLVLSPLSDEGHLSADIDLGGKRSEAVTARFIPLITVGTLMEVGVPVFAVEWSHEFRSVNTIATVETAPWVNTALEDEPESLSPVIPVLWTIHAHVTAALQFICEGRLPEDLAGDAP